jgi:hypothetical protein
MNDNFADRKTMMELTEEIKTVSIQSVQSLRKMKSAVSILARCVNPGPTWMPALWIKEDARRI